MAAILYQKGLKTLREIGAEIFLDSVHALEIFGKENACKLLLHCEEICEEDKVTMIDAIIHLANLSLVDITVILKQINDKK